MSNSITYGTNQPPPVAPNTAPTKKYNNAQIVTYFKTSFGTNPYLKGLPVQYISIPQDKNRIIENPINIDFKESPFTYLYFSNITEIDSPQFSVVLSNVPIGTSFVIIGPNSWESSSGTLELDDNSLANYSIEITENKTMLFVRVEDGFRTILLD